MVLMIILILVSIIGGIAASMSGFYPPVPLLSEVFIITLALPSFIELMKADKKKSFYLIIILSCFAMFIESIGVITGIPYGGFSYTTKIGYKILGITPWSVAFAYVPLVLGAMAISSSIATGWKRIVMAAFTMVGYDLVLDPVAAFHSIWIWEQVGWYFGIPLSNYIGWLLTSLVSCTIAYLIMKKFPLEASNSLLFFSLFWTAAAFTIGLWPVGIIGSFYITFIAANIRHQLA